MDLTYVRFLSMDLVCTRRRTQATMVNKSEDHCYHQQQPRGLTLVSNPPQTNHDRREFLNRFSATSAAGGETALDSASVVSQAICRTCEGLHPQHPDPSRFRYQDIDALRGRRCLDIICVALAAVPSFRMVFLVVTRDPIERNCAVTQP